MWSKVWWHHSPGIVFSYLQILSKKFFSRKKGFGFSMKNKNLMFLKTAFKFKCDDPWDASLRPLSDSLVAAAGFLS